MTRRVAHTHNADRLSLLPMTMYVAVSGLVLGYLALVASWVALRSLGKLRRSTAMLTRDATTRESMLDAIERHIAAVDIVSAKVDRMRTELADARVEAAEALEEAVRTRAHQQELAAEVDRMLGDAARALRNVALVRFDAADDMTGRLSFALAMLDDRGDGITITSLAGPTETRLYAKGVTDGVGEPRLSTEEQRAVDAALLRRNVRPVEIIPSRKAS
jgi:signal transduction histidine kinase